MKHLSFVLQVLMLFAVVVLNISIVIQGHVIAQQRQLIKEMAANPQCLIPLHITEN